MADNDLAPFVLENVKELGSSEKKGSGALRCCLQSDCEWGLPADGLREVSQSVAVQSQDTDIGLCLCIPTPCR